MSAPTWSNERRKLSALIPWPRNPRQIKGESVRRLQESFEEFGQPEVIAISPSNDVYNGHQRLKSWFAKFGDIEVDVRVASRPLTEKERERLTVLLHRGAVGEWNFETLANEFDVGELLEWGFTEMELGLDGAVAVNGDAEPQVDRAAELRQKWGVEAGDLWRVGEHRLICGDCTDAAVVERVLNGEKPAIVSDPPYGINVDTSWLSALNVQRGKPANVSDDLLIGDDGTLDLSWVYQYPQWLVFGFPYIARAEQYTGLLIWDKRGDGGEDGLGNPVEVAASNIFNGYRLSRHVWAGYVREAGEKRHPHPTQKPVGIMADAIELVKGPIILDPFLGSGTTMVACQNLGRRCRAVEIAPGYCAVALQRMLDAFGITGERIE